jgi:hypothetical protein
VRVLGQQRSGLVLGLVHAGQFTLGIGEDPVIVAGDRLLIAEAQLGRCRTADRRT